MRKIFIHSYFIFLILILSLPKELLSQNVGVGTSTPHASAVLEVQSTNKGMLVPRIALTSANVAAPVSSPADALLVFNTATTGSGSNSVSPGFYYWNAASSRWTAIGGPTNTSSVGFGTWGDCPGNNISDYNPVAADDGVAGDFLGLDASMSGNYTIVGAPYDDIGVNIDQGSAYIFYFNGSTWIQQQKLTASDGTANDAFGTRVSMSGNYAIVSSLSDAIGANAYQGSAYIYFFNGSTWVQQQKIVAPDGTAGDYFGSSVSISGNYAIIGAASDTPGGSAYIFFYNGSSWVAQQKLTASDALADDAFGNEVSISGNYAVVGAVGDDIGANNDRGSAYVFFYNGSTWVQQQKLTASDGTAGDYFGVSVSVSGNYIVVGAYAEYTGPNTFQGSAYVFYFNGTWTEQQKLTSPDGAAFDSFGERVFISGNYIAVSSIYDDIGAVTDQGSVTIFQNINGIWQVLQKAVMPGGRSNDRFGSSCAINNNRFVIGAFGVYNGSNRGMAFFGKIN
jgi:hypothetical protein